MKCDRAQELISARIDREIIFEGEELDGHLEHCAACRDELEGMRRLETILWRAYAPEREAAEVLVDKVKASLQARGRNVNRCTVLLVDDEPDILVPLRGLLADEFDMLIASSARRRPGAVRPARDRHHPDRPAHAGNDRRGTAGVGPGPLTRGRSGSCGPGYGDLEDAVDAVNRGQVFRYLTKPVRQPRCRAQRPARRRPHPAAGARIPARAYAN